VDALAFGFMDTSTAPYRLYGRVQSRRISPRKQALFADALARRSIAFTLGQVFDPRVSFPDRALWFEIGFGGGEHLAAQAALNPNVGFIGAEPFVNGVVAALEHLEAGGQDNVRLHHGDARDLITVMPDDVLDRIFILFPDPWPKSRHRKRRLISADVPHQLVRVLKPGGRLRFVTDWRDYASWAYERLSGAGLHCPSGMGPEHFVAAPIADGPAPNFPESVYQAPADHVPTRYQAKALGDTPPIFLDFTKSK
jgi:tRNA (guanine-N7-)-methyltransferase